MPKKKKIKKDIKELVKARLNMLSEDVNVSIGLDGSYNKDELIKHVDAEDDIGRKIVEIDMEFLRALKKGELYEQNTFGYQTQS